MNHRDLYLKWLCYLALTVLFVLLQGLVLNHITVLNTHPFVFPLLVAAITILEPLYESGFYALGLGFLCDLTLPGMLPCFYTVTFLLIALLCTVVAAKVIVPSLACCAVCGALSIGVCDLFNAMILHYRHDTSFFASLQLTGRELLLSILLVPFIYLMFRWIHLRAKRD